MRCVARAPGAGGSTRKQFSIHIAQLLFDKHNYHPRLVTVKLLAAAVCIVPHCCATLVSISWWEPPDIRNQTSHRHAEKCRVMLRDTWQLRWCCVTAKMMLRDSWGDAAWHVTAAAGDAAWHVTAAGCPRDLSCRNLTNQRLRRYGSQSHPVRYVMYCKTALFAVLSGCHIEMKCGCGLNPRFCFV